MIKYLLAFIMLILLSNSQSKQGILQLNDNNFKKTIEQHKNIILQFYSPQCEFCIQFQSVFKQIYEEYSSKDKQIIFAKVDITKNPKLKQEYYIQYYPTIFYIKSKRFIYFQGDLMKKSEFKNWIELKSSIQITKIQNKQQLQKYYTQPKTILFYYGDTNITILETLDILQIDFEQIPFSHINKKGLIKGLSYGSIYIYIPQNKQQYLQYIGQIQVDKLYEWISYTITPAILPLDQYSINLLFQKNISAMILFNFSKQDQTIQNVHRIMQKYCPSDNFLLICIQAKQNSQHTSKLLQWLQFKILGGSKLFIFNNLKNRVYPYSKIVQEIKQEQFLDYYQKYLKSQHDETKLDQEQYNDIVKLLQGDRSNTEDIEKQDDQESQEQQSQQL